VAARVPLPASAPAGWVGLDRWRQYMSSDGMADTDFLAGRLSSVPRTFPAFKGTIS